MSAYRQIADLAEAGAHDRFWYAGTACDLVGVRRSSTLLVTFDNLATVDERPQTRPWPPWMWQRAETLGFSILGVESHEKDWYRNAEAPALIEGLRDAGYFDGFENVLFIGASMGGFAALCFAGLVPGARVLAFSPQSTLNRDIAPFETRYPYAFRRYDWQTPPYLDAAETAGRIAGGHIFFDPFVEEDRLHAARLAGARLHPAKIPHAGHILIRVVIKAGAFEGLLKSYAETGRIPAEFWRQMRNRRDNRQWARRFLADAEARGDGRLLRRACRYLHSRHGYRFARLTLMRLKQSGAPAPAEMREAQ